MIRIQSNEHDRTTGYSKLVCLHFRGRQSCSAITVVCHTWQQSVWIELLKNSGGGAHASSRYLGVGLNTKFHSNINLLQLHESLCLPLLQYGLYWDFMLLAHAGMWC